MSTLAKFYCISFAIVEPLIFLDTPYKSTDYTPSFMTSMVHYSVDHSCSLVQLEKDDRLDICWRITWLLQGGLQWRCSYHRFYRAHRIRKESFWLFKKPMFWLSRRVQWVAIGLLTYLDLWRDPGVSEAGIPPHNLKVARVVTVKRITQSLSGTLKINLQESPFWLSFFLSVTSTSYHLHN